MSDVQIRTLKNGPFEVRGKVTLSDASRAEFKLGDEPIYLCRCGQSANKPFCDGTHSKCGFQAEEPAR